MHPSCATPTCHVLGRPNLGLFRSPPHGQLIQQQVEVLWRSGLHAPLYLVLRRLLRCCLVPRLLLCMQLVQLTPCPLQVNHATAC